MADEVLGVGLDHAAVAGDGALDVVELNLEDLGAPTAELHESFALLALRQLVELGVVERGDVLPAIHGHGQALDVSERLLVAGVEGQRARVRVEGGGVISERVFLKRCNPVQELDLLERVVRAPDLHFVDANELGPVAGCLVDRLEHRGRAERVVGDIF